MTSQTSRIVADELRKQKEHALWKADLRALKRLHVQENRLMQALASKALTATDEQVNTPTHRIAADWVPTGHG